MPLRVRLRCADSQTIAEKVSMPLLQRTRLLAHPASGKGDGRRVGSVPVLWPRALGDRSIIAGVSMRPSPRVYRTSHPAGRSLLNLMSGAGRSHRTPLEAASRTTCGGLFPCGHCTSRVNARLRDPGDCCGCTCLWTADGHIRRDCCGPALWPNPRQTHRTRFMSRRWLKQAVYVEARRPVLLEDAVS